MAVKAAISFYERVGIGGSYRLIRVAFAALWKEGIIPLIGLAFPSYPQAARGSS
jgi:hypothetical protein